MSSEETEAQLSNLTLPIKKTTGETLEDRLTSNAYDNILPARYLRKDETGEVIETPEELFDRIASNIALAEAVHTELDEPILVNPTHVKKNASEKHRREITDEVFGPDVELDDTSAETELTEENVKYMDYNSLINDLPQDARDDVETAREEYLELMNYLRFIPNSPTIMNAGDELQQLSACFVLSPEDDIDDIHQKAKEAAKIFQCLTEDTYVYTENDGLKKISEITTEHNIRQRGTFKPVTETHEYDNADVITVNLENGQTLTGTPNHKIWVNGDWTRFDEICSGDEICISLDWIQKDASLVALKHVDSGAKWGENRTIQSNDIIEHYNNGLSDYEIADELDVSSSAIQKRRSQELQLPPNSETGRKKFCGNIGKEEFKELYENGHTDGEIADILSVSKSSVRRARVNMDLKPNGRPVKDVRQPNFLTAPLAELLGMWIGDGSFHRDGVRFSVYRDETVERIRTLSNRLFSTGVSVSDADGNYEVTINSHEVKRWWETNFGEYKRSSKEARTPSQITCSSEQVICSYLKGLFTTDGTLTNEKYPRFYSSSEELVKSVHTLLHGVGVPSQSWETDKEREYYSVAPISSSIEVFLEKIGFVGERTNVAKSNVSGGETSTYTEPEGSRWEIAVESVEESGKDTVYDIAVGDNPEYLANSIVSHNSGGGCGYAFWRLRPYGDRVGSTGGIASGPISFMRTYDQVCATIAQGGKRRGAQMGVMKVSHPDIPYFIHAKNKDVSLAQTLLLNDPDDYRHHSFGDALEEARSLITDDGKVPDHLRNAAEGHLSNFNISVGVTDDFMEALKNDEDYTLTNPRTGEPHIATPETKELYGWFDLDEYVEVGEELSIPATVIWERIIEGAHENGEPGVIYLERANKEHSFDVTRDENSEYEMYATNPCVAEGTLVNTPKGPRKVENIDVGDEITTVIGSETVDSIETHTDYEVYDVEFSDGGEMEVTGQHRFHVLKENSGKIEELPLHEVEEGDHVRLHLPSLDSEGTEEDYDEFFKEGKSLLEDTGLNTESSSEVNEQALLMEEENRVFETPEITTPGSPKSSFDVTSLQSRKQFVGLLDGLLAVEGEICLHSDAPEIRWNIPSQELAHDIRNALISIGLKSRITLADSDNSTYTVSVSGTSAIKYAEMSDVGEFEPEMGELLFELRRNWVPDGDDSTVEIVSIQKSDERKTVYDLYCEESDTWVTEGYVQQGCGEQPLMEYEACNLGHINLSTIVSEDADEQDWRVWNEKNAGEGSLSEQVERFLEQSIDWEDFNHRIKWSTRFLDSVVTMSDFPIDEIEQTVASNRKIGLGIMGLAQLYVQLGVEYGSDVADEIARQLMQHINHSSKHTSHDLALSRGKFDNWSDSKYANPTEYPSWFRKMTGLEPENWDEGYPIRNHNTTTIAPTGTTSMLGNTTGGCEPMFNVAYYKNVSEDVQGEEMLVEFDDYFLRTLEENDINVESVKEEAKEQMSNNNFDGVEGLSTVPDELGNLFVTTGDLGAIQHASIQCELQSGVDSAISKTINAPNDATIDDTDEVFRYVYDNGGKGVTYYRDGTRSKQVLTTRADNKEMADDLDADDIIELVTEKADSDGGTEFVKSLLDELDMVELSE